jgi:predicted DNA-binding transcriptional regulator YafY
MNATARQVLHGGILTSQLKAVFDRLLGLFDAEDSKRLRLLAEKFAFAQLPPSPVNKDVWGTILKALQEQERLEIVYKAGGRGSATTRRYDAYGLIVRDRDWYVIGHCHLEKGLRTLGLPFIQEAKPIDEFFDIPKAFNLKNYAKTGFHAMHSEKEPVQEVVLRFDPEVAGRVQARPFTADQKAEEEPSGHLTVRFKTSALFRVEREVLSWGTSVEVLSPKSLRNRIKQISEELAHKYAASMG